MPARLALIAILGAAGMISAGSAEAQHTPSVTQPRFITGYVKIDCYRDSDLKNTGTKNTITIEIRGPAADTVTVMPTNDLCEPDALGSILTLGIADFYGVSKAFTSMMEYPMTSVVLSTDGDDAFWIDQLSLQGGLGGHGHWGVNGEKGYCLSTDPKDADGSWKSVVGATGCRPRLEFFVGGGVQ